MIIQLHVLIRYRRGRSWIWTEIHSLCEYRGKYSVILVWIWYTSSRASMCGFSYSAIVLLNNMQLRLRYVMRSLFYVVSICLKIGVNRETAYIFYLFSFSLIYIYIYIYISVTVAKKSTIANTHISDTNLRLSWLYG